MKPFSKRYFQDFETQTKLDGKGRPRQELVYIGNTYTALMPEAALRRRKRVRLILAVLCAAAFVAANNVNVASNRRGVLAALGILIVIPLFLVCYSCVCGLRKPQTLRRTEYIETSMFLKFGSFFSGVLGVVLLVWHGVYAARNALPGELGGEVFVTAAWGVLAGCCVFLWITELRTEYRVRNREGNVIHKEHFKRRGSEL